ncbi:D-alanyl-D-alanine carboxypeptidase/D-alanyl-D-alanine-endopeptidase [Variovorax sp. PCZ-1]|uniref:D-alanyl-D-alanine carboxypeptidase/D-alanyl-D-alanine endopeptidase n=1 Tax=Variovorax sp. PCZ-1 TaxID=2835533 RepID=UPI001BCC4DC3|nr:D-alanyl-D-alanine carboxypeptidase/D-alanyl-D-alanine-endopeptidase [Variovorax sp. PCZ-1]MBS7808990.1 D-alanyl-D-alanine carboxypeptidase/D-alanyl-D-alanine-endopeptidase [Variovorax sp. PCZ-1]
MTNTRMQRFFYGLLITSGCLANLMAQPLPKEVTQALSRAGVPASAISIVVQTVPAQASPTAALEPALIKHRAETSVNPASVMKLITTYAALDQLGADFTWKNRVYIDGTLDADVLQGNLIIRGSGDPKLVLERIEELFRQVQAKGVREVRGDILLDRRVFDVPDKNPADFDDEPLRPYNAVPDGMLVNFKALIYNFIPDPVTKKVMLRVDPPIAGVELPTEITASYGNCGDWRSSLQADFSNPDRVSFSGRYPISCGERVWPVAYVAPRQYAARVIDAMWRKSGGLLSGQVREEALPRTARLLHSEPSLPLSDIIADVNKFSNNVMAQQVFLTLSNQFPSPGRTGSFAASQRNVAAWWKARLPDAAAPTLDNGSGLSRKERSSAAAINSLLQLAASGPQSQVFANSLGLAGVDGTVARMRDRNGTSAAIGQAQLKTGTLRDVAAIAGYANASNGQRYSLAAIINHPNAGAARPALDALVEWVVKRP